MINFIMIVAAAVTQPSEDALVDDFAKEVASATRELKQSGERLVRQAGRGQLVFDRRLALCREAHGREDIWDHLRQRAKNDQTLGEASEVMQTCLVYLQGRQDELAERINRTDRLLAE